MSSGNDLVIFPGSFDPFTLGHLDIVNRAAGLFDRVEVAVGVNDAKKALLSPEERVDLAAIVTRHLENVEATSFSGLISAYAASRGAMAIIRGLRQSGDFEFEVRMAHANAELTGGLETIFLPASAEFSSISATVVRDVYRWGGDISAFVPPPVAEALARRRTRSA